MGKRRYDTSDINLYQTVLNVQQQKDDSLLYLIDKFTPLIKKYSLLLNYPDAEQDLVLAFIEILVKMPLSELEHNNSKNSKQIILSYIKVPMRNKYISLSRQKQEISHYEKRLDDNYSYHYSNSFLNSDVLITLKDGLSKLSQRQKKVIILVIILK